MSVRRGGGGKLISISLEKEGRGTLVTKISVNLESFKKFDSFHMGVIINVCLLFFYLVIVISRDDQ